VGKGPEDCQKGILNLKTYGWHGWKMPRNDPNDPDYCEYGCPICRKAREGNPFAAFLQKAELFLTGGGCSWGKARKRKYGVNPDEPLPSR